MAGRGPSVSCGPMPFREASRHTRSRRVTAGAALVLGGLVAACSPAEPAAGPATTPTSTLRTVTVRAEVVGTLPHDPTAFTQGLELHDGVLIESTGLVGFSSLRVTDLRTGDERRVTVPPPHFAEGATVVGDLIVQLTWRTGVAFTYDRSSLAPGPTFRYAGEGWGICDDGTRLVQSDGSARLTFRARDTFAVIGHVDVVDDEGRPVRRLNELECVPPTGGTLRPPLSAAGPTVWANVWQTDTVVGIDPTTGAVRAELDVAALRPPGAGPDDVANGIALDRSDGTLLLTGKRWPLIHRVRLTSG